MVFLVLALTWAVVLTFYFRSRSQHAFPDSVTQFHRSLRVIQRAAPGTRPAANRLRGPRSRPLLISAATAATMAESEWFDGSAAPGLAGDGPGRLSVSDPSLDDGVPAAFEEGRADGPGWPDDPGRVDDLGQADDPGWADDLGRVGGRVRRRSESLDRDASTARRRQLQRRRRDVLIVLAVVVAATFILTLLDGVRDAAMAQIGSDVVLGGYILLLVRTNHAGSRRRGRHSARALRRLRTPPAVRAGRFAAPGYAPAGGWQQPEVGWQPDGGWQPGRDWDAAGDRDSGGGMDAAVGWAPAGGRDSEGGWEGARGWDPVSGWDPATDADDTAGFEAVTLRPAVGR